VRAQSLVDRNGHDAIQAEAQKAQDAIDAGDWELATDYWASTEWVVIDKTHGVDFYNILKFEDYWGRQRQPGSKDEEAYRGLARHIRKRRSAVRRPCTVIHRGQSDQSKVAHADSGREVINE
jgi:hypothetical protein